MSNLSNSDRTGSSWCSRRSFLAHTSMVALAPSLIGTGIVNAWGRSEKERPIVLKGPGTRYVPRIKAAFVRRQGEYGMLWPGAIYDGEQALKLYRGQLLAAAQKLGLKVDLRSLPIYSLAEADAWLADAKAEKPDGLLIMLLDRQQHAWPTAVKAWETQIPTVVFAPVGTAFTTNSISLAGKPGVYICSTSDFSQAAFGLKMIKAGAKLREMRFIVLKGNRRLDSNLEFFGTRLRYLPASSFLEEYNRTPLTDEIKSMASAYLKAALRIVGPTRDDLCNGIKSYVVARNILEREEGDGITMDCLGALGKSSVSLPCISWSKMLDQGIPAACEADLGAAVTHALVQYLFDRPGFQQDPVPETARECLIGAHCSCPTRLHGFDQKPERYDIRHHHGKRDAVPRPLWRVGQRMTVADVMVGRQELTAKPGEDTTPRMVIGTGSVVDNVSVPPAGGCVVSVMVKLDTQPELLAYPGFHQLFFYGDFKKELMAYCQLQRIQAVVA